jgi:hypothetical protein
MAAITVAAFSITKRKTGPPPTTWWGIMLHKMHVHEDSGVAETKPERATRSAGRGSDRQRELRGTFQLTRINARK